MTNKKTNPAFDYFYSNFLQIFEESFPLVTLSKSKANSNNQPWMTRGLRKTCRKRIILYKKYTRGEINKKSYIDYRNKQRQLLRSVESRYYRNLFSTKSEGTRKMWKVLGDTLNPKKIKQTTQIRKLITEGTNITDDQEIANSLNKHFTSIGSKLATKLPNSEKYFRDYLKNPQENSFFASPFDEKDIEHILISLKNKKAPGPDKIPNKILKLAADYIKKPLCYIINLSLKEGVFPESLKTAHIIPIYKKGEHSDPSNYRPISLLSCFHKILEICMKIRISNFLQNNHIIYKYQFGFRENHSTNLALLDVTEQIYKHLDEKYYCIGLYLDLCKAFDSISNILISKLLLSPHPKRTNTHYKPTDNINGLCSQAYIFLD